MERENSQFRSQNDGANTRELMSQMNVSGYPTLIIEKDGALMRVLHSAYYGKTNEWKTYLASLVLSDKTP